MAVNENHHLQKARMERHINELTEKLEKATQDKVQLTQQLNSSTIAPVNKGQSKIKMKELEEKIVQLNK